MRPVVLLTNAIDPDRAAVLARYAEVRLSPAVDAETLRRAVQDAHAVIVRATLPEDVFRHAPVLRGVVRHGAGVDMIPMREANALGVPVANTPRVNAVSVAEYVVGQMANLAHRLAATMHRLHNGGWTPARTHGSGARELAGKAVGIIGVGAVGGEVARICREGFRMSVLGHQRNVEHLPEGVGPASLDELLRASDYVVVSCALTDATRGLLSRDKLGLMRQSACIINVSRGAVIDESALVYALRAGRIAGAALDVFQDQPLPATHPLLALDNVVLTPHVAGITVESMQRMSAVAVAETLRILRGEQPEHLVNLEAWPAVRERWARLGPLPLMESA